ncbi:MAG: sugar kinase [Planctomycetes bacterium]|nr:sugar kinase [Planctomycetota bacterium]
MSLLVTGSIGIDSVSSPFGTVQNVLGGSAVYFALAACPFVPVRLVGVVGDDFPREFHDVLAGRNIDLAGLERRPGSRTFRWSGRYAGDMNAAETVSVDLNVLAEAGPGVPPAFADSQVVFLANTHPALQRALLSQLSGPRLVVCDTMNLWINHERSALLETLRAVGGLIVNDGEARLLTDITNRFAGGFLGYLAREERWDFAALRRALVRGTVTASFAIEDFSIRRIAAVSRQEIDERAARYAGMLAVE